MNAMSREAAYENKSGDYFQGERRDVVDQLQPDPHRAILEIGCGDGATAEYARREGKCGRYVGVELSAAAAALAARSLDQVLVGDIESMDLPLEAASFDVLIASEVLEHLVDPWSVLQRLRPLLRPGARVFASSPNVAHKSTFAMLLAGRWDLEDSGRMDRTHLRWFTPRTFQDMFEQCGYRVVRLGSVRPPSAKTRLVNALTGRRFSHLFVSQIMLEAIAA